MYRIPPTAISHEERNTNAKPPLIVPKTVDICCPSCGRMVTFTLNWSAVDLNVVHTKSKCPACQTLPIFMLMDWKPNDAGTEQRPLLYVHPSPRAMKAANSGFMGLPSVPEELKRAYLSSVNVYNVGEWNATSVMCRRALEGLAKSLLPAEHKDQTLARLIKCLPQHIDLADPLTRLADAIREGGNLGAHFDLFQDTDDETATLMMDLLEYLLDYLFVLPERINRLATKLDTATTPSS